MSNVGHHDSEPGKDKKPDPGPQAQTIQLAAGANTARLAELISQPENQLKFSGTIKQNLTRPIAPAPSTVVTGKHPQHALVSKAAGMGSNIEGISLQQQHGGPPGSQTVPVNLSTQMAAGAHGSQASTQALHITMTSVSTPSLHTLTAALSHVSAPGLVQTQGFPAQVSGAVDNKEKARLTVMASANVADQERLKTLPVPMASLIRGAVSLPQTQVSLALAQAQVQAHAAGTTQVQSNPTHSSIIQALPHQHIPRGPAAASALAATKVGNLATPILRTQSTSGQIQSNSPLLPTITAQLQPRAQFPVRAGTPPVTQLVTTPTGHSQAEIQRQAHLMTTLAAGSQAVQISGLQGRPVLSQVQHTKGLPQGYTAQPQKVVVSQSMSPFLTQGTGGPTLVSVTAPKIAGQNLALNLAAQQGTTRTQKIITTQGAHLTAQAQVSLAANLAGGQTLNIGQALPRAQKVVVTQASLSGNIPAGAVVVNTTPKLGHPAINLSQTMQRPQKVVMSHVAPSSVMPTSGPVTVASLPKGVGGMNIHRAPVAQVITSTVPASTMVTTSAVSSVPSVKRNVPLQKPTPQQSQVAMALSQQQQAQQDHPHVVQAHRDGSQAKLPVGQTPVSSSAQVQASLYGLSSAQPRVASTNNQVTLSAAMASNVQPVTQAEARNQAQERLTLQHPHLTFPIAEYGNMSQPANFYQPYNFVYPVRPGLVPGQQAANIAATIQAATQAITTITATQSAVRINPSVMVSVDPSHHGAISMATAQVAGTKTSEVPHVSATAVSMAPAAAASHPATVVPANLTHPAHSTNQQHGGGASQPTNASPRPSILRKRPHDGERVMIVKRNLLSSVNAADSSSSNSTADAALHHLAATASPKPSIPCDPMRENSQSSTDTASSAESTPQSGAPQEVKVKQEPLDAVENGAAAGLALFSQLQNNVEASPRKKPRKQRLNANEELKDGNSSDEELDKLAEEDIKQELEWLSEEREKRGMKEFVDDEGVKWTRERPRPPVSLMNHYCCNWKPKNNHFQRYQDVKPKEERRPTVNELANQKAIHQKASGWKIFHLAAQLEELMDMERDVFRSMSTVQESIAPKHIAKNPTMEDDISMVHELTQGNIQRCQLVMDQLEEAKASMVKVLDHKQRIVDIINKHHSKRPVKKKERP